jgi:hypothetical protein
MLSSSAEMTVMHINVAFKPVHTHTSLYLSPDCPSCDVYRRLLQESALSQPVFEIYSAEQQQLVVGRELMLHSAMVWGVRDGQETYHLKVQSRSRSVTLGSLTLSAYWHCYLRAAP